jgi:hypothetical protein
MNDEPKPGIYLLINFDWPEPFANEHGVKARKLHDVVQGVSWIKEVVAASGGIGGGQESVWIFWLENYAALDRLLQDDDDEVAQAYRSFFTEMVAVEERIRQEVVFL